MIFFLFIFGLTFSSSLAEYIKASLVEGDLTDFGVYVAMCGLDYNRTNLEREYSFQKQMNHTYDRRLPKPRCDVWKHNNKSYEQVRTITFMYPLEKFEQRYAVCVLQKYVKSMIPVLLKAEIRKALDPLEWKYSKPFKWTISAQNSSGHKIIEPHACIAAIGHEDFYLQIESETRYFIQYWPMDINRIKADSRELIAHNKKLVKEIEPTPNYGINELTETQPTTTIATTIEEVLATPMIRNLPNENQGEQEYVKIPIKILLNGIYVLIGIGIFVFGCLMTLSILRSRIKRNKSRWIPLIPSVDCTHEEANCSENSSAYEIEETNLESGERLGGGFYGNVYSGRLDISKQWGIKFSIQTKIPVAVKIHRSDESSEHAALAEKMLKDELKILCTVGSHPNIVTLIGAITKNNLRLIVEKCDNDNLKQYLTRNSTHFVPQWQQNWTFTELKQNGLIDSNGQEPLNTFLALGYREPMDKEKWKRILKTGLATSHLISFGMQIAQGMEFLVSRKCIHRDLAARNILLTSKGLCKLSDFGLAKPLVGKEYYRNKTDNYLPLRWMAPESIEHATPRSDVWSFGIVLYEIFTLGGRPFPDLKPEDLPEFIRSGGHCEQPNLCHTIIYNHMKKCWNLKPDDRPTFADCSELLEEHLFISSRKLLEDVREELSSEWEKQKKLATIRIK